MALGSWLRGFGPVLAQSSVVGTLARGGLATLWEVETGRRGQGPLKSTFSMA